MITPEDKQFLDTTYTGRWKLVSQAPLEGAKRGLDGLIISDFVLPAGYMPKASKLMVLIPSCYPFSMLDMFYFSPAITRSDEKQIPCVEEKIVFFDQKWQLWERRYVESHPWDPNCDSLISHVGWIENVLRYELIPPVCA